MKLTGALAGLALLSGCSTHPITGRDQILALPAVQAVHADVTFALTTGAQGIVASPGCAEGCESVEDSSAFARRVAQIGARLEASARSMAPDLFERIDIFQIEVNDGLGVGTASSAGGRIALGAGLVRLEPTDAVIAFLVAREMAHVIARHAEEDSGAAIVFSVLGMLLPGINFIVRFAATRLGSTALTGSWAALQQREADDIAIALLEQNGMPARAVALELDVGINRARLPEGEWSARYLESARYAARIAASPPRYAVNDSLNDNLNGN